MSEQWATEVAQPAKAAAHSAQSQERRAGASRHRRVSLVVKSLAIVDSVFPLMKEEAMLRNLSALATLLLLASPAYAHDSEWKIDTAHTATQFSIRHMMISNVRGEFGTTTGSVQFDGKDPTKAKVEATIEIGSINTREPKRDEHLKSAEFLDAAQYPTMKFVSKKIEKAGKAKYKMTGDLTLHGVTKEVVHDVEGLTAVVKDPRGNEKVGASATAKINRKDFGVSYNAVLETGGVMVGDEVSITIDVELVKKQSQASSEGKGKPGGNG